MGSFNTQDGLQLDAGAVARRINALEALMGVGGGAAGPFLAANGSAAAPSYSFAGDAGRGMYSRAYGIGFSAFGSAMAELDGNSQFRLRSNYSVGWSSGDPSVVSSDLLLSRDAANTLAQRNGTSAQTSNLYGSYTDASNYERIALIGGVGTQTIQAQSAGTGSANIGFAYSTKGTGSHAFNTGGGPQFAIVNTANSANYLTVNGGSAGAGPSLVAVGSDTNVAIAIAQKGTAIMQLSGQTTGTTVGAAGTAAAIPTPAAYLTLNVNGTNYRIPLCN